MTKLDLQKELLEKVKPGTKPSDIKRQVKQSQIPKPVNQDEGYSSDEGKNFADSKKADNNQKNFSVVSSENNFADSEKKLLDQITSLKNQLQVYQDFKEADLKIKEKYKQEIAECKKTIAELKTQAKIPTESKQQPNETTSPKLYLFTCDICEQTKKSQLHLGKVNGLGIDPNKENKICSSCFRKVDLIKEKEDFF